MVLKKVGVIKLKPKPKQKNHKPKQENVLEKVVNPIMHEFKAKDLLQIIIGATILAIPVGFTQESWEVGKRISPLVSGVFVLLSLLFISTFVYYYYHRHRTEDPRGHKKAFVKRVLFTYTGSFALVAILLTLITTSGVDWAVVEWIEALKIITIVTLPASMSAAIADTLK